jgi:mRNA guanylyltransferase
MFDPNDIKTPRVPLPLVRKNFCNRTEMDDLLQKVSEERGMRIYSNGVAHNHLTDGIIFQPNLPYVCGTDMNLLKWKYLDTVTIDVELMELRYNDPEGSLRVACLGEDQTRVDMTRFVMLPKSERLKMEADRAASGRCMITEVGLDPESGEWYYL